MQQKLQRLFIDPSLPKIFSILPLAVGLVILVVPASAFHFPNTANEGNPAVYREYRAVTISSLSTEKKARTVRGTVLDDKGEGLPGAYVAIKGSNKGTVTDGNGAYTIEVDNANAILVFSFIGCISQEITVGTQQIINVTLETDTRTLKEVVITGYGDVAKLTYTGAAQSVSMNDIQVQGVADATQMLQGRSAGVNIQTVSGTFGAGPKSLFIIFSRG